MRLNVGLLALAAQAFADTTTDSTAAATTTTTTETVIEDEEFVCNVDGVWKVDWGNQCGFGDNTCYNLMSKDFEADALSGFFTFSLDDIPQGLLDQNLTAWQGFHAVEMNSMYAYSNHHFIAGLAEDTGALSCGTPGDLAHYTLTFGNNCNWFTMTPVEDDCAQRLALFSAGNWSCIEGCGPAGLQSKEGSKLGKSKSKGSKGHMFADGAGVGGGLAIGASGLALGALGMHFGKKKRITIPASLRSLGRKAAAAVPVRQTEVEQQNAEFGIDVPELTETTPLRPLGSIQ
eukprot:CAMPEP_0205828116 /NCGR_PEP_ID=MMETSP0206-20130828/34136_1 /ASSEMBLY_ACC=CAM_ASM_000279 /TAXON_ID=36767 /ORGANISM="Euplotes focardii, Strain TN1" /LENGTH=288 /DNA_ID=CAMNT_0053129631 /DNA_START=33 /DNA_END=899 /DNA_ORIENTATION=-